MNNKYAETCRNISINQCALLFLGWSRDMWSDVVQIWLRPRKTACVASAVNFVGYCPSSWITSVKPVTVFKVCVYVLLDVYFCTAYAWTFFEFVIVFFQCFTVKREPQAWPICVCITNMACKHILVRPVEGTVVWWEEPWRFFLLIFTFLSKGCQLDYVPWIDISSDG